MATPSSTLHPRAFLPLRLCCSLRPVRGAFTLVELLVVISIIGVLAALLLPVLVRDKEKAQGIACMSNSRQLALAMQLYAHDYQDLFPLKGKTWSVYVPQDTLPEVQQWVREHYAHAVKPTEALVLLGGAVLGQGAVLLAAAGVMGVGLLKSYSPGGVRGSGGGVGILGLPDKVCADWHATGGGQRAARATGEEWHCVRRSLAVDVSGRVRGGRQAEGVLGRRAESVANANDFSWHKRLAPYEAALEMLADKPWFGFGWNQPEQVYNAFYRSPKVDEGMAFLLNDYLMLGTTLGVPGLVCFAAYVGLALTGNPREQRTTLNIEHRTSNFEPGVSQSKEAQASHSPALTLESHRAVAPSQRVGLWTLGCATVCRAGAVVLRVGFWFDDGLFRLATGATFWMLLELGGGDLQTVTTEVA